MSVIEHPDIEIYFLSIQYFVKSCLLWGGPRGISFFSKYLFTTSLLTMQQLQKDVIIYCKSIMEQSHIFEFFPQNLFLLILLWAWKNINPKIMWNITSFNFFVYSILYLDYKKVTGSTYESQITKTLKYISLNGKIKLFKQNSTDHNVY